MDRSSANAEVRPKRPNVLLGSARQRVTIRPNFGKNSAPLLWRFVPAAHVNLKSLGDFTFWISPLSLTQSKIRTERKLNQKWSRFFVRTQSELRTELWTERKTELIVWSEVPTESEVNLNYSYSVQMNLHARDRLIPYRLTFAERKTTSLFWLIQTNRISAKKSLLTFYLSITSLLTLYEF